MAQTRKQKEGIVKELADKLKNSKAAVFSDFKGLSVKNMMELRNELRKAGVELKVAKKTLIDLALKDAGIKIDARKLEGQLSLALSMEDEVVAAKIIAKTAKDNENLKIIGGILGKDALTQKEVLALSLIPGKQELLAKLVRSINAPVSGLANILAGNIRGLVQVLKAVSDSKPAQ